MAAYRRTQRSSLQLGLRVGGHLALTDFGMAGAIDDSTINIVVVIIIIIWPVSIALYINILQEHCHISDFNNLQIIDRKTEIIDVQFIKH